MFVAATQQPDGLSQALAVFGMLGQCHCQANERERSANAHATTEASQWSQKCRQAEAETDGTKLY